MNAILCDGCGQVATSEHVAERIQRFELATRFRPIHIQVLFLAAAPCSKIENDFYNAAGLEHQAAGGWAKCFFDALGITGGSHEECLAEFQGRGFYLAFASECPLIGAIPVTAEGALVSQAAEARLTQLAPSIAKRIQFSYKPRLVLPVSRAILSLAGPLKEAGAAKLLGPADGSFADGPFVCDPSAGQKEFAALRRIVAAGGRR